MTTRATAAIRSEDKYIEYKGRTARCALFRYASVYRQFKDVDTFIRELTKILEENKGQ